MNVGGRLAAFAILTQILFSFRDCAINSCAEDSRYSIAAASLRCCSFFDLSSAFGITTKSPSLLLIDSLIDWAAISSRISRKPHFCELVRFKRYVTLLKRLSQYGFFILFSQAPGAKMKYMLEDLVEQGFKPDRFHSDLPSGLLQFPYQYNP
ncbi:hypothetical protein Y032_0339g2959 [Ancylostoma ceylanicum]|uniref:Uncharacterized protein n=1 Tax=Ancylostoma ceylanicum TaxID=53326 RepID=A0A016RY22_9BILA|nr:hypothetical protein Y032_0339g2959 [Ancylostoma ceylanicum]